MTVDAYLKLLEGRLLAMPLTLFPQAAGAVVFVFRQSTGPRRATVELGPQGATIRDGARVVGDVKVAHVFATIEDWVEYFEHGARERLAKIDLYGETGLLKVLAGPSTENPMAALQASSEKAIGWSIH
jgi:hypothetical protein